MGRMAAGSVLDNVVSRLVRRYGKPREADRARILTFGSAITCSLNYSKLLRGNKYFFGLPSSILDENHAFEKTLLGEFVLLICGSADNTLVLPRLLVSEMMRGVSSRRLDVFVEGMTYILQTTRHPKCDVTQYLNTFPAATRPEGTNDTDEQHAQTVDRIHARVQFGLIALGQAEGCSVWVPVNDRNSSYQKQSFSSRTLERLPNFGFDENTRRIVQNIDVLWLRRNVILKAFEIESTTSIYSGLLRLNDLVLAQPNIQIDLYILAAKARRERVFSQLLRPSFQSLLPKCGFLTFEHITEQMNHLQNFPVESGARISGLIKGEKFTMPDHFLYPDHL
jgi:hypothetical protein